MEVDRSQVELAKKVLRVCGGSEDVAVQSIVPTLVVVEYNDGRDAAESLARKIIREAKREMDAEEQTQ